VLPSLPKIVGPGLAGDPTLLGLAAKPGLKHFQKEPTMLGPVAQQDPRVLGLA